MGYRDERVGELDGSDPMLVCALDDVGEGLLGATFAKSNDYSFGDIEHSRVDVSLFG